MGVDTNSPTAKFEIRKSGGAATDIDFKSSGRGQFQGGVWLNSTPDTLVGSFAPNVVGLFTASGGWGLIQNSSNVGIGTSNPQERLHVFGGGILIEGTRISNIPAQTAVMDFEQPNRFLRFNTNNSDISFNTGADGSLVTERLRILADGKIGVGITNPAEKLDVAGNAKFSGQGKAFTPNNKAGDPPETLTRMDFVLDEIKGAFKDQGKCDPKQYMKGFSAVDGKKICANLSELGQCPIGSIMKGFDAATGDIVCVTSDAIETLAKCDPGWMQVGFNTSGKIVCQKIDQGCGDGYYLAGVAAGGAAICFPYSKITSTITGCGVDQYMVGVKADGIADCKTLPLCGTDQVLTGVKSDGTLDCKAVPNCGGDGEFLKFSTATNTFSCVAAITAVECAPGEVLMKVDALGVFTCAPVPPPKVHPYCGKVFKDNNYAGTVLIFSPGASVGNLNKLSGMGDEISSVKVDFGCTLYLYEDSGYDGELISFTTDLNDIGSYWNDEASSLKCTCNN